MPCILLYTGPCYKCIILQRCSALSVFINLSSWQVNGTTMESPRGTKWRVEGSMSPATPRHHHRPASSEEDLVTKKLVAGPPSPSVSTPSPLASTPRRHSMPQQVQKLSTPRRSSSPARTPSTLGSVGRIRSNARTDSPSGNNLICQTHILHFFCLSTTWILHTSLFGNPLCSSSVKVMRGRWSGHDDWSITQKDETLRMLNWNHNNIFSYSCNGEVSCHLQCRNLGNSLFSEYQSCCGNTPNLVLDNQPPNLIDKYVTMVMLVDDELCQQTVEEPSRHNHKIQIVKIRGLGPWLSINSVIVSVIYHLHRREIQLEKVTSK